MGTWSGGALVFVVFVGLGLLWSILSRLENIHTSLLRLIGLIEKRLDRDEDLD